MWHSKWIGFLVKLWSQRCDLKHCARRVLFLSLLLWVVLVDPDCICTVGKQNHLGVGSKWSVQYMASQRDILVAYLIDGPWFLASLLISFHHSNMKEASDPPWGILGDPAMVFCPGHDSCLGASGNGVRSEKCLCRLLTSWLSGK